MSIIENLQNDFSLVAWAYHHGYDRDRGHADCTRFYDIAAEMGVDIMIDYHAMVEEVHNRNMKLIIQTSVSPDNPNDPMGDFHWGSPAANAPESDWEMLRNFKKLKADRDGAGRYLNGVRPPQYNSQSVYGNTGQLEWFEKHFGKHPAVIGYCLNDSCRPCSENILSATWLMNNAPDKIRYVSYGDPQTQDGDMFQVLSFLNFQFAYDSKPNHSRHETFAKITQTAKELKASRKCKLWWQIIPASCPDRFVTSEELDYQIKTLQDAGADGVVLFPFGVWFNEYIPEKANGHIGGVIKESAKLAKALRRSK